MAEPLDYFTPAPRPRRRRYLVSATISLVLLSAGFWRLAWAGEHHTHERIVEGWLLVIVGLWCGAFWLIRRIR
jgi:hypothetical protein